MFPSAEAWLAFLYLSDGQVHDQCLGTASSREFRKVGKDSVGRAKVLGLKILVRSVVFWSMWQSVVITCSSLQAASER